MPNEQDIAIKVTLQDSASAGLQAMAANLTSYGGKVVDLSADLNQFIAAEEAAEAQNNSTNASLENSTSAWADIASGVFAGYSAYNIASSAINAFKGFLEDSFNVAAQASGVMAMLKVNVENAGLSYTTIGPEIQAYAQAQEQVGFTSLETEQSVGKLALITGNYSQALQLNQLAMDLARNKGMDLGQATQALAMILQGSGARALSAYGLTFKDGASSAEILTELQDKLKGSTEAFAQSAAGQLATVNAQWTDIQKQMGDQLLPVAEQVFALFEQNLPAINVLVQALGSLIELTAKSFTVLLSPLALAKTVVDNFNGTSVQSANASVKASDGLNQVAAAYDKVHKGATLTGADLLTLPWAEQKKIIDQFSSSVTDTGNAFDGLGRPAKDVTTTLEKHADAVSNLTLAYDNMKEKANTDLSDLAASFESKMASIGTSISKTQQEISNLTNSFNQTQGDNTAQVADDIVASEYKAADLKKQIAASTSASQTATLQAELDTEMKNYASTALFRQNNAQAIADAEKRATETSLQREIDKYNTTTSRETTAYEQKLTDLNTTLNTEVENQKEEIALTTEKVNKEKVLLDTAQTDFIQASKDRQAQTTAEVDAEITLFNQLASAITSVKSASNLGAVGAIQTPSSASVPAKHELGGFVNAPRGTAVPIIAHGGEQIIPAEQVGGNGGGNNVAITINNPSVRSISDITELRRQIDQVMRPLLVNAKIIHI